MIIIGVNLQMLFSDTSAKKNDGYMQNAKEELKELFDDIFGITDEYIRTDVEIKDIMVVNK